MCHDPNLYVSLNSFIAFKLTGPGQNAFAMNNGWVSTGLLRGHIKYLSVLNF